MKIFEYSKSVLICIILIAIANWCVPCLGDGAETNCNFVTEDLARLITVTALQKIFGGVNFQGVTTYYLPDGTPRVYTYTFQTHEDTPVVAIASATREDVPVVMMWKGFPKHTEVAPLVREDVRNSIGIEVSDPVRVIWLDIYDVWFEFAEIHPESGHPIMYNLYNRNVTDLSTVRDMWLQKDRLLASDTTPSQQLRTQELDFYKNSCWQDITTLQSLRKSQNNIVQQDVTSDEPNYPFTKYIYGVPNFDQGPGNKDCGVVASMDIMLYWDTQGFSRLVDGQDYATLREKLRIAMNYDGEGTSASDIRSGLEEFCNHSTYGNSYSFKVTWDFEPLLWWFMFKAICVVRK